MDLDKSKKSFSITINENNRVVEEADSTNVYSSFIRFLDNLPNNRKSVFAKLYYVSEYQEYGGDMTYYGYKCDKFNYDKHFLS